jgi:hypothetical protein
VVALEITGLGARERLTKLPLSTLQAV